MQKKGYFFTLDAALGLGVLLVGAFLLFSSLTSAPPVIQTTVASEEVIEFFSTTEVRDINNEYVDILKGTGTITNEQNTLMQQIGEFYYYNKLEEANNLVQNITVGFTIKNLFEIRIDGRLIYPQSPSLSHNISKNTTKILIASNKIIYGILNQTTGEMWGPYKAEVFSWQ